MNHRNSFGSVVCGGLILAVFVAISVFAVIGRKAALERVVGHPVGWMDYILITSK